MTRSTSPISRMRYLLFFQHRRRTVVMVQKAIEKLKPVDISVIAPTHGSVWRSNPAWIVDRYDRWSRHQAEAGVVIAYASMYGNTEK